MKCPHDDSTLKEVTSEKCGTYYECPKCHCTFRLVIVKFDNKCFAKMCKKEGKKHV